MSETQATYQLFPELSGDDYAALKADIAERGVMVAVELDDEGNILDGHHRVRAWTELAYEGVSLEPYPRVIREGLSEAQKRAHVRRLNILRRHLTQEQKRELIRDQVRETPERSNRQIAGSLGVSPTTVGTIRGELESSGDVSKLDTSIDTLGRQQPVHRTHPITAEPPRTLEEWPMPLPVHEPIEDIDGEQYATLPLDAESPDVERQEAPTIGALIEPTFSVPPRGLDPHAKAWHAAVAPSMYRRLDPDAVIATREPKELERGIEMMVDTLDYVAKLVHAARTALRRSHLEVV